MSLRSEFPPLPRLNATEPPEWAKDHLYEDEMAWIGQNRSVDILLLRLARERHSHESVSRLYREQTEELQKAEPPMTPEEQAEEDAWLQQVVDTIETRRDLREMAACTARGGCEWEPYEHIVHAPFPALRCKHCLCSTSWLPDLPPPE